MPTKAKYIYGIVPNQFITERLKSLGNRAIYAISFQSLSAIVSDQDNLDIDFTNSELLGHLLVHHQKTIEYLVENGVSTIVPMRIGTVVGSTEEVIQILSNGYDLMLDILKKVEDLTEIDIAVTWADFSSVIGEIAGHPEIIAMKNEILNNPESPSAANQVMIGMLVQEKLREKNKQVELRILDALSNFSEEIKKHETMNDQMVTNSAILIRKNKDLVLEQMIDLLDEEFSGNLKFKLVGPLPCYSFFTIEAKEIHKNGIEQAQRVLGLDVEFSQDEIKKAYLIKSKIFHPDTQSGTGNEEEFNKISKAYHLMIEYATATKHLLEDKSTSMNKGSGNLILVKIRE